MKSIYEPKGKAKGYGNHTAHDFYILKKYCRKEVF